MMAANPIKESTMASRVLQLPFKRDESAGPVYILLLDPEELYSSDLPVAAIRGDRMVDSPIGMTVHGMEQHGYKVPKWVTNENIQAVLEIPPGSTGMVFCWHDTIWTWDNQSGLTNDEA